MAIEGYMQTFVWFWFTKITMRTRGSTPRWIKCFEYTVRKVRLDIDHIGNNLSRILAKIILVVSTSSTSSNAKEAIYLVSQLRNDLPTN